MLKKIRKTMMKNNCEMMRRQDTVMEKGEALALLERAEYGVLSMIDEEGKAYGIPLHYAYSEGCLYFHCAVEGRKNRAFALHPEVSFSVVGETQVLPSFFTTNLESIVLDGRVRVTSDEEKRLGLALLVEKYAPEMKSEGLRYAEVYWDRTVVYCMEIDSLCGKKKNKKVKSL